jgi:signal peptidase I
MSSKQEEESHSPGSSNNMIDTIIAILESGNSVVLPATGYSMFPTLRPGDRVLVKPVIKGEMPQPGSIIVFRENGQLVIHRLLKITPWGTGCIKLVTRGDSRPENDKILLAEQFMGVAVSYKRKGKEHYLKSTIPLAFQYEFNRYALWVFFKMKKLQHFFKFQASADDPE